MKVTNELTVYGTGTVVIESIEAREFPEDENGVHHPDVVKLTVNGIPVIVSGNDLQAAIENAFNNNTSIYSRSHRPGYVPLRER